MNPKELITKSEYVYQVLRELIFSGKLAQGEKIIANNIAKELNVSVIPVREAIGRLNSEGLVEIELHKGARVTVFESKKIEEVFSVRSLLEGYAARTAIDYINDAELKKLQQMIVKMDKCILKKDQKQYVEANKQFHSIIYEKSPFNLLRKMIYNLWDGNWSQLLSTFEPERIRYSNEEHKEIFEAIKGKKEDELEFLVRRHRSIVGKILSQHVKLMDETSKTSLIKVLKSALDSTTAD